jgi:hypothetical protein
MNEEIVNKNFLNSQGDSNFDIAAISDQLLTTVIG